MDWWLSEGVSLSKCDTKDAIAGNDHLGTSEEFGQSVRSHVSSVNFERSNSLTDDFITSVKKFRADMFAFVQ